MTVATLMADPAFTNELVVVKALREENTWLRNNYLILKRMMAQVGVKPPAKKRAAKKAAPRKATGSSTSRARAAGPQSSMRSAPNSSFRQGFEEMRG